MSFVNRAIAVMTQPNTELPRAASEPATIGGLIGGYAAILAALPALGGLLGLVLGAGSALSYIIGSFLLAMVLMYAIRDLGLPILAGFGAAALAPNFGGRRDNVGAMKLVLYAATPIWVAGFLAGLLSFAVGGIGILLVLIGFGYAGYLVYLGCRPLLGISDQQAPAFAGILTVGWLVLYFVAEAIVRNIFISAMLGGGRGYGAF